MVLLPFVYLAYVWNSLPEKVPIHWNIEGEIDRYGSKLEMALLVLLLPLVTYLMFLIIPKFDRKNKLDEMGGKLNSIKFVLTVFMVLVSLFVIYSSKNESTTNTNYIILLIGVLFTLMGNFFKTIKTNYFIGIRTPWTLKNEMVWKKTHELAGVMWFVGGILIILLCLIFTQRPNLILFLTITGTVTLVPIIYSYFKYKELSK